MNNYWREVWQRKGETIIRDVNWLDGWDTTVPIDVEYVANQIIKELDIKYNDRILEVGCGAGALARHIAPLCKYIGIDYTKSQVDKHIKILHNSVLHAEADDLPFKDNYFDKAFSYSVFHYFPDGDYFLRAFNEMLRVTKGVLFIGDLPERSPRKEHHLYKREKFKNYKITEGYWNKDRFNVVIK